MVKVTVDLSENVAAALLRWWIPPELCGPELVDKLAYLAEDAALGIELAEARDTSYSIHRLFGVRHPDDDNDDDDIPL